jgi:UDP-glucuronate decarboxylase
MNMLGLAKRTNARMLLTSTSEVYGDPKITPQPETYFGNVNTIGPRACYDEGKRVAETMMYSYHHQEGVDIRVARIFNTFGPRMHPNDGRVVSNFIIQALQGNPLTVYGKGQQTRSFQYVDDLVEGLMRLMNSDYIYPVNIGNPKGEITILEFAKLLREMINPKLDIKFLPKTKDDPTQRKPDITVAKRELHGWEPQVSVKKGLQETIKYFSDELKLQGEFTPIKPKELRGKTAQIGDV